MKKNAVWIRNVPFGHQAGSHLTSGLLGNCWSDSDWHRIPALLTLTHNLGDDERAACIEESRSERSSTAGTHPAGTLAMLEDADEREQRGRRRDEEGERLPDSREAFYLRQVAFSSEQFHQRSQTIIT